MSNHEKTKEQLESEVQLLSALSAERKESDGRYAMKIVERIVFVLVSMMAIAVIGALLRLIIK